MPLFIISLLCLITLARPSRNMSEGGSSMRVPSLISDFNEVSMFSLLFEKDTLDPVK